MARFVLRRLASGLVVLLVIALLSFLAQDYALRTRSNSSAPFGEMVVSAVRDAAAMWRGLVQGDLGTYTQSSSRFVGPETQPVSELLGEYLLNSVALLALAMILGGLLGGLCGALAAASRRHSISLALLLISVAGISTPSFFLGMLLQYLEISLHRVTGLRLVPVGGYGWDSHLILPVVVLAARPVAQVARLTYVRVAAILDEDFVRTAHAKGLSRRVVWLAHVIPNVAGTVLTAMGTSLRFSLSSLPVVEFLFGWPGAGRAMLDMLRTYQSQGATVLILVLGAVFVAANIALDILYQALDPRLRQSETELRSRICWWEWIVSLFDGLWRALTLRRWRERHRLARERAATSQSLMRRADSPGSLGDEVMLHRKARREAWVRAVAGNPALLCGTILGLALLALVIGGPAWAPHDPHQFSTSLLIGGKQFTPPVAPMSLYPLGTDAQGRDILSLILVGARRTLTIAFFAVIARLLIGGALGFVAGWFSGSRLDRAIMAAAETLAAFPSLLLAMLLVYAVGIRQGLTTFVIALAFVGWGEVMQTVRHQVIGIKPMAYVESAVAAGLSEGQILSAHVLPNVWPTMVSLGFLEMGGVLMLLGELGFLGVFIGGGLAYDQPDGLPPVFYYDVPEWSVMLSNSWRTFRSYPWATLYPALAFFVAILGFTFLGEGLRQLTERLTLSLRTLFNRYTLATAVLIALGVGWMFQSTGFYARLAPSAAMFSAERALADVRTLASDEMAGRLSGSAGADRAAKWIAGEFESLGLQPGGQDLTYYQTFVDSYRDLTGMPTLTLHGPDGQEIVAEYGRDFVRDVGRYDIGGVGRGDIQVMANTLSRYQLPQALAASFGVPLAEITRQDRIVLRLSKPSLDLLWNLGHAGVMTLSQQPLDGSRYELLAVGERSVGESRPSIVVSRDLVERIVAASDQTMEQLLARVPAPGEEGVLYWPTGWTAEISIPAAHRQGEGRNVIALWPGQDVNLDAEMVVVAAYYDGLGRLPDGTLYPGANDNASGVATMIELIRTLQASGYAPRRSILFVAWSGGERHESVDFPFFLKAARGFEQSYQIVAGLELEGVGAGEGSSMVVWRTSRERLTEVLQKSARQLDAPISTREQGLHADPDMWSAPAPGAPAAVISWSGSDLAAHTPDDTPERLDPAKLGHVGRVTALATMVLASDPAY